MGQSTSQEELNCSLWVACETGDEAVAKKLLKEGANPTSGDQHGNNAVHKAAKFGSLALVRLLLDSKKANVNSKNAKGNTPAMLAAAGRHWTVVSALVASPGADLSATNGRGLTLLHLVCRFATKESQDGAVECVKALIEKGCPVAERSGDGLTALHLALLFARLPPLIEQILLSAEQKAAKPEGKPDKSSAAKAPEPEAPAGAESSLPVASAESSLPVASAESSLPVASAESDPVAGPVVPFIDYLTPDQPPRNNLNSNIPPDSPTAPVVTAEGEDSATPGPSTPGTPGTPRAATGAPSPSVNVDIPIDGRRRSSASDEGPAYSGLGLPLGLRLAQGLGHRRNYSVGLTDDPTPQSTPPTMVRRDSAGVAGLAPGPALWPHGGAMSALFLASLLADLPIVRILLQHNANPAISCAQGLNALHVAVQGSQEALVEALLSSPMASAAVNGLDSLGNSPLIYAVAQKNLPITTLLLTHGADASIANQSGLTALHYPGALPALVDLLLAHNANPNALSLVPVLPWGVGLSALHVAVECDGPVSVVAALARKAPATVLAPGLANVTPLHSAAALGNAPVVHCLVSSGAEANTLDAEGFTPLHSAIQTQALDVVKVLLESGADVNLNSHTLSDLLASSPPNSARGDGSRRLGSPNFSPSPPGLHSASPGTGNGPVVVPPLYLAACHGNLAIAAALIQKGAARTIDWLSPDGFAALHIAVANGDLPLVRLLLKHGASPALSAQPSLKTPLSVAVENGRVAVVEYLLRDHRTRVGLNSFDADGFTPLHTAASVRNLPCLRLLLAAGSNPNAISTATGVPPIITAALLKGNLSIVRALVQAGADVNYGVRTSGQWLCPILIAVLQDDLEVCKYLLLDAKVDLSALDSSMRETLAKFMETVRHEKQLTAQWTAPEDLRSALTTARLSLAPKSPSSPLSDPVSPTASPPVEISPPTSPPRRGGKGHGHGPGHGHGGVGAVPMNPWTLRHSQSAATIPGPSSSRSQRPVGASKRLAYPSLHGKADLRLDDPTAPALALPDTVELPDEDDEASDGPDEGPEGVDSPEVRDEKLAQMKALLTLTVPHPSDSAPDATDELFAGPFAPGLAVESEGADGTDGEELESSDEYARLAQISDVIIHTDHTDKE